MKIIMRQLITGFLLLLASMSMGASTIHQNISVSKFSALDQFPSSSVQRILQDREGYLWFGTLDGLCRYDAYRVLVFRSDTKNPNLLTSNEITCIAEDMDSNIWIGTRNGINILDKKTYQIKQLDMPDFKNLHIKSMLVASDSTVWIAADNRLYRYNTKLQEAEPISTRDSKLPITGINSLYEDKFGDIWITFWGGGLHKYTKKGEVIHYPKIGNNNNPFTIYQDNQHQYWVGTWGEGVYQFYPHQTPSAMYVPQKVMNWDGSESEDTFYSILQDDTNGYIWLMTFSGVYALRRTENNEIKQVDISHLFKGTNNIFSELVKDQSGDLWIAAFGEGAFTINFDKSQISDIKLQQINNRLGLIPNITSIYQDGEGTLWFNQNRYGLCLYHPESKEFLTYKEISTLRDRDGLKYVSSICGIRNSKDVWLGHYNQPEIYVVNKQGKQIVIKERYDLRHNYPNAGNIREIFEDSKNNVWIVTTNNVYIKPQNRTQIELVDINMYAISSITEDVQGKIWLGTENSGIYKVEMEVLANGKIKYDIKNYNKEKTQLSSNKVTTIYADTKSQVWFGTSEGAVYVFDQETQKLENYTQRIRLANEAVQNIVEDNSNNIWVTTNKRVIEYNPQNGASRDYSQADGLCVSSFSKNSLYYNRKTDVLFLGGNKGINMFAASLEASKPHKAKNVVIADIKISGKSIINNSLNTESKDLGATLQVEANDKNIEIDFSSLDYRYPSKILYAYKMEGIDDDWVYTDRQFATYNQLNKGLNTFMVKATDENKLWTSDITNYAIYKKPAFYETWWAYLIYTLLILLAIYTALVITKNRLTLKNRLKIAQIEKEKSEELTQVKLKYFTNISHDFLTPLTIISCLIDDLEMGLKNRSPQFGIMRINVDRLKRLLQQVLDFRKVESGNMKLKIAQGDLSSFIEDICLNNFTPLAQKKKIKFTFKSIPQQIEAYFDADKIDKALYNIISNAFKFTPNEGTIEVVAKTHTKFETDYVSISVSDTGMGISVDEQQSVFERFYTNKNSKIDNTNGIGLSISYDLIKLHHGQVLVSSELGKGSTFTIEIPIDKAAYSAQEITNTLPTILDSDELETIYEDEIMEEQEHYSPDNSVNVLIVEDNEDILFTIRNILQKQYNVYTASNGAMALEIVKDNNIDIIVSDVMMPEMDGLELCRTIKGDLETSHISILLLTAKNRVEDRIECYEAGTDGYISKPFDMKVLVARISNLLNKKKQKQQEFKANREIKIETLGYPSLDEQFLTDAVKIIENNLSDSDFNIDTYSTLLNLSKSSLYRKLKTMTSLSPNEFIRNIRLKHACQMLKDPSISISEVAYSVGFTDPRYFSTCFRNEFEMTPTEYQKAQN